MDALAPWLRRIEARLRRLYISAMTTEPKTPPKPPNAATADEAKPDASPAPDAATEIGGRKGPEPTRYGDWEKDGRCVDF